LWRECLQTGDELVGLRVDEPGRHVRTNTAGHRRLNLPQPLCINADYRHSGKADSQAFSDIADFMVNRGGN
jgi:hypothetical protein